MIRRKVVLVGYYSSEIYNVSLFLIRAILSLAIRLNLFSLFSSFSRYCLAFSRSNATRIARERARCKATSKIAAQPSTTKPQGKANRSLSPPPYSVTSPWISNDPRVHVADTPVFQYRWRFEYTDQLVLDVPQRRHMRLSTWREIDDRVDKWVPTAFLSVSPGCSSLMHDGWRSMCKIGKRS